MRSRLLNCALLVALAAVGDAAVVGGHPLPQHAAALAARQARFTPMLFKGRPAKVSGVITYNFVLQ